MNKIAYTLTYAMLFVAGAIADAWTTYRLTRSTEYGIFRELNPLVNLDSFTTILISPLNLARDIRLHRSGRLVRVQQRHCSQTAGWITKQYFAGTLLSSVT